MKKTISTFLLLWACLYATIRIQPYDYGPDPCTVTLNQMRSVLGALEYDWSLEHPPTLNEKWNRLDEFLTKCEPQNLLDGWGNRLQFVINDKSTHEARTPEVLVYSRGEDGKSVSGGNDPDDVRLWAHSAVGSEKTTGSWSMSSGPHEYYHTRRNSQWDWRLWYIWRSRFWRSMIFALAAALILLGFRVLLNNNEGADDSNYSEIGQ